MCLPGTASIPAVDAARARAAEATGAHAVTLALEGPRPSDILTAEAFDNAITLLMALGGGTNAVVHLLGTRRARRRAADARPLRRALGAHPADRERAAFRRAPGRGPPARRRDRRRARRARAAPARRGTHGRRDARRRLRAGERPQRDLDPRRAACRRGRSRGRARLARALGRDRQTQRRVAGTAAPPRPRRRLRRHLRSRREDRRGRRHARLRARVAERRPEGRTGHARMGPASDPEAACSSAESRTWCGSPTRG